MLFAYPTGVQGNVVNAGVNEFIIPNYKQTWGNIRKLADAPAVAEAPELQVLGVPGGDLSPPGCTSRGRLGAGRGLSSSCRNEFSRNVEPDGDISGAR